MSSGEIFQSPNESNPGVNTPISGEPWVLGDSPTISGRSTTKERYRNTPLVLLFVLVPNLRSKVVCDPISSCSLSLPLVPATPENRKRSSGEIFQSPNESNPGVNTPISGEPWVLGDSPAIFDRSTTKERYRNTPLVLLFILVPNLGSKVVCGSRPEL
ncbi:hypothetical protein DVH24_032268 [Malus domestica]|uniref:Uncharacterized protein n=1 Tax=Malus domestica TaxID=3750 RepID=A0A498J934_MALDO|nr:hypothetical protein DVH24_032268 [Malus domestica]